jgi:hypothetical protein
MQVCSLLFLSHLDTNLKFCSFWGWDCSFWLGDLFTTLLL